VDPDKPISQQDKPAVLHRINLLIGKVVVQPVLPATQLLIKVMLVSGTMNVRAFAQPLQPVPKQIKHAKLNHRQMADSQEISMVSLAIVMQNTRQEQHLSVTHEAIQALPVKMQEIVMAIVLQPILDISPIPMTRHVEQSAMETGKEAVSMDIIVL
jgi:hypothetical protein